MPTLVHIDALYPHNEDHTKVRALLADTEAVADAKARVAKALRESADIYGPKHGLPALTSGIEISVTGADHT